MKSWWFLYPGGAMALPAETAEAWQKAGRPVVHATYAEAVAMTPKKPVDREPAALGNAAGGSDVPATLWDAMGGLSK